MHPDRRCVVWATAPAIALSFAVPIGRLMFTDARRCWAGSESRACCASCTDVMVATSALDPAPGIITVAPSMWGKKALADAVNVEDPATVVKVPETPR